MINAEPPITITNQVETHVSFSQSGHISVAVFLFLQVCS